MKKNTKKKIISIGLIFSFGLLWGVIFLLINKHTDWLSYAEGFTMAVLGCYLGWWCGHE